MRKKTISKIAALLLSVLMTAAMMPALACNVYAEQSADDALTEISKQLNDEDADPFAYGIGNISTKKRGAYPARFDLREEGYVTPIKFQNPFGSCWGFSAIAAAETSILSSGITSEDADTLNLSEKHLIYFLNQTVEIEDQDENDPHSQNGEGMVFDGPQESSDLLNTGGVPFFATGLFASGTGPVIEDSEELEYHGKNKTIQYSSGEPVCYSADDDWSVSTSQRWRQSYVLSESFQLPSPAGLEEPERGFAINAIKEQVRSGRGVEIGYKSDTYLPIQDTTKKAKYINTDNWAHYTYYEKNVDISANHAVTIIGWDDNYPKENFSHDENGKTPTEETVDPTPAPEHDGAWLVKNSWGSHEEQFPNRGPLSGWGLLKGQDKGVFNDETGKYEYLPDEGAVNTGYFWLSYDDESVSMVEALAFDKPNTEEGYYLCEYDFMPVNSVGAAYQDTKVSMANVFIAEDDGKIESVSCQTTAPGTGVLYDVYLLDDDAEVPTAGERVTGASATYEYGGFHKADLDEPVLVKKGQKFSVVVTQMTPDNKYALSVQKGRNQIFSQMYWEFFQIKLPSYAQSVINEGESLFLSEGKWYDLHDQDIQEKLLKADYFDLDNFPIKAYMAKAEVLTVKYDLNGGTLDGKTGVLDKNVEKGTTITLPMPTRSGYEFDYWEGSVYHAGDEYTVNEDHTFTAQWKVAEGTDADDEDADADPGKSKGTKTGDETMLVLWVALLTASLLAVVLLIRARMRSRNKKEGEKTK